ncbi:MAG: sulfurtransferase [Chloroflexi bacterium HGW-Chloroflexi-4]|jgi:NADPH-dependent 2,4-dienoyl-CoA reductase/sulfur reductase-like enzyme/Fe-S-cluster-containing hydrogenase component 2/bacterioferritin-associated ferredoxin|nr:MAG: sulfurtransferase [Chloroflexi bacterium HGW-Chloroflexi-4]
MTDYRISKHPILNIPIRNAISFTWQGKALPAMQGETIASALFANGIKIFGHHHKDKSPLGIFCANGQCSQCMVIADGLPVKACMHTITDGMQVFPNDGDPVLPEVKTQPTFNPVPEINVPVLIIGGGPAGLSAAIELGKLGINALLVDDKHRLGGKLVLQTHRFFGSADAVYAGTRGIDIATILEKDLSQYPSIEVWLQSTCLAVYSDQKVGILKNASEYVLVNPEILLVACGAREKFLAFKGNTLPGVYGAGAFQTLVNRDLVKPAEKLFIVGGGNVGLIAGYHALQAGINVIGLVEALPECGGYKVHKDKLVRMGVPIHTSHTILSANGVENVESVSIAAVDENFVPIPGSEQSFECDAILIAVGLDPVSEFYQKAVDFNMKAFVAGDAEEIAEASAAIFSGKIKGLEIAQAMGKDIGEIPASWYRTGAILKSRPGNVFTEDLPNLAEGVVPIFHCSQEIPCDPCSSLCPHGLIIVDKEDIRSVPSFVGNNYCCEVCEKCVAGCPGLAITLVDYRTNPEKPIVSIPYEFSSEMITRDDIVTILDTEGNSLCDTEVFDIHSIKTSDRTMIIQVETDKEMAPHIAGIRIQSPRISQPMFQYVNHVTDDTIVCRCEHVSAGEIRALIRQGYKDINEIKTVTRACMGACGAKTCASLIRRIFREEGIPNDKIIDPSKRPLFIEVSLGNLAGENSEESK